MFCAPCSPARRRERLVVSISGVDLVREAHRHASLSAVGLEVHTTRRDVGLVIGTLLSVCPRVQNVYVYLQPYKYPYVRAECRVAPVWPELQRVVICTSSPISVVHPQDVSVHVVYDPPHKFAPKCEQRIG